MRFPRLGRRAPIFTPLLLALLASPLVPAACGSSGSTDGEGGSTGSHGKTTGNQSNGSGSGGGAAGGGGGIGGSISVGTGGGSLLDQSSCTTGQACGDGGVCTGETCCAANLACGDLCCAATDVCSFQKCVTPGVACHDSSDCSASEYCELSLGDSGDAGLPMEAGSDAGCQGGAAQATGKCLPRPPTCAADAGTPDGGALTCLEACDFHPTASFNPVLKYSWGGQVTPPFSTDIMMTPIVVQLDDDDCDGKVTERDIPEIVFSTFSGGAYHGAGTLHAISIVNAQVVDKWSVPGVVDPAKQIAGGNIDGLPGNEVVACGLDGAVHAFKGDGTPLWTSAAVTCFMPSIADLDGDGKPEVVVEGGILNGADGTLKSAFSSPLNGPFVISDIDGDGQLDVVTSSRGYHADGTLFVDTGIAAAGMYDGTSDWKGPWAAVADLDKDGKPEIIAVDNLNHALSVWRYDATQANKFVSVRAPTDINSLFGTNTCGGWGATHGGGPPTVADFDGDGTPDVGLAGGIGYVVFNGKKLIDAAVAGSDTILWAKPTHDCSSASTGSSVFDFDGDGKAEVIYSDEYYLRVYDGTNGNELLKTCNTTATLVEYPVIADVDNDGHADIVVVSNAYGSTCPDDGSKQAGIRIFGDQNNSWVRTRGVWNEHAYHVTNVEEDGTVPQHELPNWTQAGLNDFRQNKQPGNEFSAPDAVVSLAAACVSPYELIATVRNVGQAALPAGVVVGFYAVTPGGGKLGSGVTTRVLYPAESEEVVLSIANPDPSILNGSTKVFAVVDDTTTPHPSWNECRKDNDTSETVSGACTVPN